jgi:hypothetical protein
MKLAPLMHTMASPWRCSHLPTREERLARAASPNHWVAYHAKQNLARLDRGEKLIAGLFDREFHPQPVEQRATWGHQRVTRPLISGIEETYQAVVAQCERLL